MTYKIYTLGCKVNQYDSQSLAGKLQAAGWETAEKNASKVFINTCAVTKTAIHKARRMIKKAQKENPGAEIFIMGCWPKVYKEDLSKEMGEIKLLMDKEDFEKAISETDLDFESVSCNSIIPNERTRYSIKIQDGCEQFCSFCVIPYARGKLKSRPASDVLKEIKAAVENGYQEIVLCGIHLGLYGKDLKADKINLTGLMKSIMTIKNLGRLRLSSIEITEVTDEMIGLMKNNKKICQHLHIPLQSGSDKILKLMNRPYDRDYFRQKTRKIRQARPDISLTTDVIVGFPGETEKEFKETFDFIQEMNFSRLHVFPFSAHEKTPAARLDGKVSNEIKKERTKKLKALGEKLARDYKKKFNGQELEILVEQKRDGKYLIGKSEFYFDVQFLPEEISNDEKILHGKIIRVKKWR